jgi:hypothetical protein
MVRQRAGRPGFYASCCHLYSAEHLGSGGVQPLVKISYFGAASGCWKAHEVSEHTNEQLRPGTGDLFLNESCYLSNVPEKVWSYGLGGYPVIKKWLGSRDSARSGGVPLSLDQLRHLRGIVQRIAAILLLETELDRLYENVIADSFTIDQFGIS